MSISVHPLHVGHMRLINWRRTIVYCPSVWLQYIREWTVSLFVCSCSVRIRFHNILEFIRKFRVSDGSNFIHFFINAEQSRELNAARGHLMLHLICIMHFLSLRTIPFLHRNRLTRLRASPCWHRNGLARMDSVLAYGHRVARDGQRTEPDSRLCTV